jgi:aspartate/methionine/tyrosine aminotransferase
MFSARTHWNPAANQLSQAVARRRQAGAPLIDLTGSNPTQVGLGFPVERLVAALADPGAARYEPDPSGLAPARTAIAGWYRARCLEVPIDRVVVTASTSEAYAFLFKLLCDPGDEVLVPQPSYPLFEYLAVLESVKPVGYPLRYDGEWHVDRRGLEEALGARTRAIVAVSPNNPTGSYLKQGEVALLSAICRERSLALLGDEVFADYPLEPTADRAAGVLAQGEALSFSLSGISKIACAPQLKVGWLAAGGPCELVEPAMQRLEIVADTFLSPSTPSQLALPHLLAHRALAQEPMRRRLAGNLSALKARFAPGSRVSALRVEGGWSAVLRVPAGASEQETVVRLVEEDGVLVHPGFFFDFATPAYVAVSLIVEPQIFAEGIDRMARRFERP